MDAFSSKMCPDNGFSVDDVARQLQGTGIGLSEVREAANYLVGEGHLYATTDETHFKSTAS